MKTLGVFVARHYRFTFFTVLAFGLTAFASDPALAGGGSWGSSTGGFASSGGSWGSSGGSLGSRGAAWVRPTPVRNLLGRIHARHWSASSGSSGGSSGGSQGVWVTRRTLGSSGSWSGSTGSLSFASSGGYGSFGSSVGSIPTAGYVAAVDCPNCYYGSQAYYPIQSTGSIPMDAPITDGGSINSMLEGGISNPSTVPGGIQPAPVPGADSVPKIERPGPVPANDGTSTRPPNSSTAVLNLVLPEEAKIFINDKLTTTTGSMRSYVSRNLGEVRDYKYQVKAVLVRDGKELVRTKLVKMRPGLTETVNFDFDEPVMTTLALEVPADAKVKICGKEMATTGSVRSFTTNHLKDGDVWKDYKVTVEYQRDGKPHVEERTIDLLAGDMYRLSIGVEAEIKDQIASK